MQKMLETDTFPHPIFAFLNLYVQTDFPKQLIGSLTLFRLMLRSTKTPSGRPVGAEKSATHINWL